MINVFIDTSIFVKEAFVKGKSIATLFEAAYEEKIHILMPDITEHEVRQHLRMEVGKNSGRGTTGDLKKSYMYAIADLRKHIEELMAVDIETLITLVEKELDNQFSRANIEKLPLTYDLDIKAILEDYKALRPPFSEKKKSEFPDAIALKQLELWCKEHDDKCVILANDPDLKGYKNEWLEHIELEDFVSSLEDIEKLITQEKLNKVFQQSKEVIKKHINNWAYDLYDNDTLYINHLLIEDIHYSSINKVDVQLEDSLKWVGKGVGCLFYKTYATIVTSIEVSHPKYDTGFYDSEDQQWYFIDDKVVDDVEGRIRVPVTIEYNYSTDDMIVDSINNDVKLSYSEIEESLISTGSREYFADEEECEIDHVVCPHCGAEVVIKEYGIMPGFKEKEDVKCPKCHKVMCSMSTSGYLIPELMNP